MPRLLFLCEYPSLNGGEQSMLSVLTGIGKEGFVPTVLAPSDGPLAEALEAMRVETVPFNLHDSSGGKLTLSQRREELGRILHYRRPGLLHANSLSMSRLAGPVAAELGIASIGHLRDIIRLNRQVVCDVNHHTRLLAVSRATRDYHIEQGLDSQRVRVLHNGVDLTKFQPREPSGMLHRELGVLPGTPLLGTIGQIGLRKAQDVLVQAAKLCVQRGNECHFVVIGRRHSEKDESRRFEADLHAAAEGPLAGRLHILDIRDDIPAVLNELTLLIHPARQEPLGRVLLESLASGLPVVATDVGGTREILLPEADVGRLVAPNDAVGLAAAIDGLLADAATRRRMAVKARKRAETAFDVRVAAAGLAGHYNEVLATGRMANDYR